MQDRYRLYRRDNGIYYLEDVSAKKQESLRTKNRSAALGLVAARNQASQQPALNLALARTYLLGRSPELVSRTWADVIADVEKGYHGATLDRWQRFAKSPPLHSLHNIPLLETEASHLLTVLRHPRAGTSCNVWLRRLHNYALDLGWLLAPALSRKAWPQVRYKVRQGLSVLEHARIIVQEQNVERRLYYEMLWETGGAQSDIASLSRSNVDEPEGILWFHRMKLEGRGREPAQLRIGTRIAGLLEQLPKDGLLFPRIAAEAAKHRATEFRRRCRLTGVNGKTLHCYRYAWAERACEAGMPEREAMAHLGHKSAAIHRAYAKKAKVVTMPLEFYENQRTNRLIILREAKMTA
jgi:integrase